MRRQIVNPFLYQDNTGQALTSLEQETRSWKKYSVQFPIGINARYIENNNVMANITSRKGQINLRWLSWCTVWATRARYPVG